MKTLDEFRQFYEQTLYGELQRLERERKTVLNKMIFTGAAIAAIAALFLFFGAVFIAAVVIGVIVWIVIFNFSTRGYKKEFKEEVIKRMVGFLDPGLTYAPDKCIPDTVFMASRIFLQTPDRYTGDDLIYGKIGETQIHCSEVHAEYKTETTDSKGTRHTQWHTIFGGIFFVADFNKDFDGSTVVLPDFAQHLFGNLGLLAQSWNITRGEHIQLEDPEFEKLFVVYGNDQIEARYILSPSLMKRIVDFKNRSGKQVYLSFVQSKMCVAISYAGSLFEPEISKSLLDFDSLRPYFEDLELVVGVVDDFNLNTRIWSKV